MPRYSEKYLKGVMVLMAAVVLLPSIALLWFVSKTIENEKYVLREKLAEQYTQLVHEKQPEVMERVAERSRIWNQKMAELETDETEQVDLEMITKTIDEHLGEIRKLRNRKEYGDATEDLLVIVKMPHDPIVKMVAYYWLLELNSRPFPHRVSSRYTIEQFSFYGSPKRLMDRFTEAAVAAAKKNRDFSEMLYERALPIYAVQTMRNKVNDNLIKSLIVERQKEAFDDLPRDDNGELLTVVDLAAPLDAYALEIRFRDGSFAASTERQEFFYFWLAVVVIVMMLLGAFFLITMIARWSRLHRLRNDFLATISHELKTPLTSIRLLVDTLQENVIHDPSSRAEYLEMIASQNERLSHLIDNFLSYSRMERDKGQFHLEEVDPREIAAEAVKATRPAFSGRCELQLDMPEDLPPVSADKEIMVTAVVNLLENALKYTEEHKEITLRLFRENGQICFAVEDNGCGMTERQQKKIFQKFYRADNRLVRQTEGVGLGLAIVRFIVDAHRGKIDVTSEVDHGSTFTIRLPAIST